MTKPLTEAQSRAEIEREYDMEMRHANHERDLRLFEIAARRHQHLCEQEARAREIAELEADPDIPAEVIAALRENMTANGEVWEAQFEHLAGAYTELAAHKIEIIDSEKKSRLSVADDAEDAAGSHFTN